MQTMVSPSCRGEQENKEIKGKLGVEVKEVIGNIVGW